MRGVPVETTAANMLALSEQSSTEVASMSSFTTKLSLSHASPKVSSSNETSATKVFVRVRPFSAVERFKSVVDNNESSITDTHLQQPILDVSVENPSLITTLDPSRAYQPKTTYVFDHCFNSAHLSLGEEGMQQSMVDEYRSAGTPSTPVKSLDEMRKPGVWNPIVLASLMRDQAAVYDRVGRPVLQNALAGYNGCVFAYGQTGSGKTYTMMGPPGTFGVAHSQTAVPSAASTPRRKFRRAATAVGGALKSVPDVNRNEPVDSRFHPMASMTTNRTRVRTPRTGDLRNTPRDPRDGVPPPEASSFGRFDALPNRGGRDGSTFFTEDEEGLLGIVPRLVRDLFVELQAKRERDSSHSFRVEVAYYEIYREKVMDLLTGAGGASVSSVNGSTELRVRHSKTTGPYVENLSKAHVENEREVFELLRHGNLRRHTAATAMNDRSSRSHAIFSIHLVQMHISDDDSTSAKVTSKVNLVDLAGSERGGAHGAEGELFKEGVVINSSLTVLGRVIDALADMSSGKRHIFCPYRDSVLTWLLMDSLGGNSKTTMVATVSPHVANFDEACQTLRYASRAKQIVTKVVVNEDPQVRQIKLLTAEVQRLKTLLISEGKPIDTDDDVEALQERILALEGELNDARSELDQKTSELAAFHALQQKTNSLVPSTLKPSNAGSLGSAKELAKAKAEMRRLEAENLLHTQTEQELYQTTERLKALEKKYGQVLSDTKRSQETIKQLERDVQERNKLIAELQQQTITTHDSRSASFSEISFPPPSTQRLERSATTACMMTSTVVRSGTAGYAKASADSGKRQMKVKSRSSLTMSSIEVSETQLTVTPAHRSSAQPRDAVLSLEQVEEEKKQLTHQLLERSDAYRKSQLEVKRLKNELKSEQEMGKHAEKQLHDQHADAMRRLQEELLDVKRAYKEERRHSKELMQRIGAPAEDQPTFSFNFVTKAFGEEEVRLRAEVQQEEAADYQRLRDAGHLSRRLAESRAAAETRAKDVAALQATLQEQQHRSEQTEAIILQLEKEHLALRAAKIDNESALQAMQADLEKAQNSLVLAERASQAEAAQWNQQVEALRQRIIQLEKNSLTVTERETSLKSKIADLECQLQQEQELRTTELKRLKKDLAVQSEAVTTAEKSMVALQLSHAQKLAEAEDTRRAQAASHAVSMQSLRSQLKEAEASLRQSEEARRSHIAQSAEQAKAHQAAVASLQSELEESRRAGASASEKHSAERGTLKERLASQEKEAKHRITALEKDLETASTQLNKVRDESAVHSAALLNQASESQAAQTKLKAALKQHIQRSVELETAHQERLAALREEVEKERSKGETAAHTHATAVHKLEEQIRQLRKQCSDTTDSLPQQIADLQDRLSASEQERVSLNQLIVVAKAAEEANRVKLQAELGSVKAACAAFARAHEEKERQWKDEAAERAAQTVAIVSTLETRLGESEATRLALETAIATERAEHNQKRNTLEKELQKSEEARLREEELSHRQVEKQKQALVEMRSQLQEERVLTARSHEEQLHKLEESHSRDRRAADAAIATLQKELKEEQEKTQQLRKELSAANASLKRELAKLQTELETSEQNRELQAQRNKEESAAYEEKEAKLRAQIDSLVAEAAAAEATHVDALEELQRRHNKYKALAAAQLANAENASAEARQKYEQLAAEHQDALGREQKANLSLQMALKESEKARASQQQETIALSKTHEKALQDAERTHHDREKVTAATLIAAHSKQLEESEAKMRQDIETVKESEAAKRREREEHYRMELAMMTKKHSEMLAALQSDREQIRARLEEVEAVAAAAKRRNAQLLAEQAKTNETLESQLRDAQEANAASAAQHQADLKEWKNNMDVLRRTSKSDVDVLTKRLQETERQLKQSDAERQKTTETVGKQADAHAASLAALRRSLEAAHQQQLQNVAETNTAALTGLQAQVKKQKNVVDKCQSELDDARAQMRKMVETQNHLGKEVEVERKISADLRKTLTNTVAQHKSTATAKATLETELEHERHASAQLRGEKSKLVSQLANAVEETDAMHAFLTEAQRLSQSQQDELKSQAAALSDANAEIQQLRESAAALRRQCKDLEATNTSLAKRHEEELVSRNIDTVTELESQFRIMKEERDVMAEQWKRKEEDLCAVIERQSKELRVLREDSEFRASLEICEAEVVRRTTSSGVVGTANRHSGSAGTGPFDSAPAERKSSGMFRRSVSFTTARNFSATPNGNNNSILGLKLPSFFTNLNTTAGRVNTPVISNGARGDDGASAGPHGQQGLPHLRRSSVVTDDSAHSTPPRGNDNKDLHCASSTRSSSLAASTTLFTKSGPTPAGTASGSATVSSSRTPPPQKTEVATPGNGENKAPKTPLYVRAPNLAFGRK